MSDVHENIPPKPEKEAGSPRAILPRAIAWIGIGLLALLSLIWVLTYLRPNSIALSPLRSTPNPSMADGSGLSATVVDNPNETPIEPLLQSESAGQGLWSPDGNYFFIPLGDVPAPGGDRRMISLHFISTATGEDCQASETFLGQHGFQNYAWLDNKRVLYIDNKGKPYLFTACMSGSDDLSDRFTEPLLRVAILLSSPDPPLQGPLLLESASTYWLLDPLSLQARALRDPVPSSDQVDSFAWLASEHQMAILQPSAEQPEISHLVLLSLDSGEVLRSLEIKASNEGRGPISEWLGPQQLFVWAMEPSGPLLLDLSQEPVQPVPVFAELFGIDMLYPDQLFSIGVFYAPDGDKYHIAFNTNFPDDKSIYLYHSESGQVEKLDGNRQVMMIFPGDQRMPLVPMTDGPVEDGSYDVLWVDAPDRPPVHVEVSGHLPRKYSMLQSRLLPGGTRMLFGSSQGISLVDLPSGKTLSFWRLTGAEESLLPLLYLSPDGRLLIAVTESNESKPQGSGLYRLVLGD
jgi:hypothetical protein